MKRQPALTDVDTDQQENGVETFVDDRPDSAARLGITSRDVDNALYNAFGQRQVATIYDELNQYHVIMEVAPQYARSPEALNDVYVPAEAAPRAAASRRANRCRRPPPRRPPASGASAAINPALRDPSTRLGR